MAERDQARELAGIENFRGLLSLSQRDAPHLGHVAHRRIRKPNNPRDSSELQYGARGQNYEK